MNPWIDRARSGDPVATTRVVEALRPRIEKMAAYYARRCGEDAEDLLQEAWVGLLEALPALDMSIGQPEQYLIQRARWRLLDAVKRARVRRCVPLEETVADSLLASRSGYTEAVACAREFMQRLNDSQRAVLECLLAGLTWREAGRALGCTSANIAYYVRQIRRQYEAWSGDELASRD